MLQNFNLYEKENYAKFYRSNKNANVLKFFQ